ncbi:MAG: helix-hairpin-helix domain-containing protein [Myxococcaceae bacterium]|nr:helix-hairpin-helix domain-containing protein [Myxococcaceae bacterium]
MAVAAVAVALALMVAAPAWAAKKIVSGVVNLNTATAAQLELLPGVGEKAAKRIIEHRQKAPFKRIEEIVKVKGFGKKKFEKMRAFLTVTGPTTAKGLGGAKHARKSRGHSGH